MEKSWSSGWEPNHSYRSVRRKVTGTDKRRRKATTEAPDSNVKPEILETNN